jgi:hypothetical protein
MEFRKISNYLALIIYDIYVIFIYIDLCIAKRKLYFVYLKKEQSPLIYIYYHTKETKINSSCLAVIGSGKSEAKMFPSNLIEYDILRLYY